MLNKIKKITIRDILGCLIFLVALVPALIYRVYLRLSKKELWLVSETANRARDNGYVFFCYLKREHPEIASFYAIDKSCPDYKKVSALGNTVDWASFKHYFYYMSATKNISSHKEGNPNHSLFTVLHLYLNLFNNRVFLQHGVIKDDLPMFYYKNTKFQKFICGAKPEFDYIEQVYGYPKGHVIYTGLARFDNLHNVKPNKDIILFIPTWRRWIENKEQLIESNYYKKMVKFLESKELEELLTKTGKTLYFYPHESTQKFIDEFDIKNERVKTLSIKNSDIQKILIEGSLLITDHSSLFFDFAYMKKPIIYYHYDIEEYRQKHTREGYFNFNNYGFGKVCFEKNEVIHELESIIK
ncbi:MAG TPA: teichoic acid biosynthesis protein B, partial [Firmicutes bacterium]|nr:teichoic acid biosynthesis protein B [Bacillota bacterium]